MNITIYTDGACNSGPNQKGAINKVGWGAVFLNEQGQIFQMLHGYSENTTNNREELTAIKEALLYAEHLNKITDGGLQSIEIISDSAYAVNTLKEGGWLESWKKADFTRKGGKPIENLDIIKTIDNSLSYFKYNKNFLNCKVTFTHCKGHSLNCMNEIADGLATHNTKKIEKILGRNPELMGVNKNDLCDW